MLMKSARVTLTLFVLLALGADAPVASDPVFSALLVDGSTVSGRLRQLGAGGEVTLVALDGAERVLPASTLVRLTREGLNQTLTPEPSAVLFPEGDRLYRTAIGASTETTLDVQSFSLDGKLAVPLESILGLIFAQPNDPEALDIQVQRVRSEPRRSEVLWLTNEDRVSGGFLGLSDKSVKFQSGKDAVEFDRGGVATLGFDPALVAYPKPKGTFFELTLADGSRLGVTDAKLELGQVVATTRFGASIRVKLGELTLVRPRSGTINDLTDRPVAAARYQPYVGEPRPYRLGATVDGHPFRLSGQEYDRGIGAESRTILAFRLKPGDKRFQAMVGLDDRAGAFGSVVFRVMVDRDERFRTAPMSARDSPKAVDIDVSGGKSLILITEFGDRGGVRDLADWVETRILR